MREVKCDHALEHPKLHPVAEYVNIGNIVIAMCGTCYNALRGQILGNDLEKLLTLQTVQHISTINLESTKLPPPRQTRKFRKS